jgi:predicted alternative tryptophan synthase beta-subunit
MLESAPSYIFYPVLALWSLVYGALAGAWFKLLAAYENWIEMNRYYLILWKKYPRRSYEKYISGIWATQIKDKPVELAEYTRHQIEKHRPTEPFPIGRIVLNTVVMLIVTPFIVLTGLYKGPIYVFRRAVARRRELLINE